MSEETAMLAQGLSVESINVAGIETRVYRGGEGPPLLLLHGIEGNPGCLQYQQALTERCSLYAPSHPGFGWTPRPQWLERPCDLTVFYLWMMQELGLDRAHLMGHGVGGWLAADMATTAPQVVDRLILISPMGIKPRVGEIRDLFLMTQDEVRSASYYDRDQVAEWERLHGSERTPEENEHSEAALEMLVRLYWKPYMHDLRLPHLLARIQRPTLIVCGRDDAMLPLECGEQYQRGIAGSELAVLDNCGHFPQLEKTREFCEIVDQFLA